MKYFITFLMIAWLPFECLYKKAFKQQSQVGNFLMKKFVYYLVKR